MAITLCGLFFMAIRQSRVVWDLKGLRQLQKFLKGNDPLFRKTMTSIGTLYQVFTDKRYDKFSKGGGTWRKLKPKTVERKSKKGGGRGTARATVNQRRTGGPTAILVDNGILKNSLRSAGAVKMVKRKTIRVGFSTTRQHEGTGLTMAELADIHQRGLGKGLPKRPIFVEPDSATKKRMRRAIMIAIEKAGDMNNGSR